MTFEELKAEAEKQGYNLIAKPPKKVKLLPCPCGRKQLSIWGRSNPEEYLVSCPKCGNGEDNEWCRKERQARLLWNEYVGGAE